MFLWLIRRNHTLHRKNLGYYVSQFYSGSTVFIYELHQKLKENILNFNGHIDKTGHALNCGINDTRRLSDFMYSKSRKELKMDRKYQRFLKCGKVNLPKNFLPYKDALRFSKKLKLKNSKEWYDFRKSDKMPLFIPHNPHQYYKGKGWTNWYDWLGNSKKQPTME